jgi:carbon storage regulator CsrA
LTNHTQGISKCTWCFGDVKSYGEKSRLNSYRGGEQRRESKMLILSRKVEERTFITVGDEKIELVVVRIEGGKVRLGFKASDKVSILRAELVENPSEKT